MLESNSGLLLRPDEEGVNVFSSPQEENSLNKNTGHLLLAQLNTLILEQKREAGCSPQLLGVEGTEMDALESEPLECRLGVFPSQG